MVTDNDAEVKSSAIVLDNPNDQVISPITGAAQKVTVVDSQGADKTYTFVGWYMQLTDSDGNPLAKSPRQLVSTDLFVTPQKNSSGMYENAIYFAVFHEENEGMGSFKVEHYFQDLEGKYPTTPDNIVTEWGNVDDPAIASIMTVTGFTLDPATVLRGADITAGDTGIVLKIYYTRNVHKVSFAYVGNVPTGAPLLPYDIADVMYGADVNVDAVSKTLGHSFIGWSSTDAVLILKDGSQSFVMPDSDVVLTGYFQADDYTVVFTSDAGKATVTGAGASQLVPYGTQVVVLDPATGAPWVVVTRDQSNSQVQYGWTYTVTDESGKVTVKDAFVYDPSTLNVSGNMVFTVNWIDGYTVKYVVGDSSKGGFAEGVGLTEFAGLTPADEIAKLAAFNSTTGSDGKPLAKAGYTFMFWQWGSGDAIFTSDKYPMPVYADANYTFTAVWDDFNRTLSFDVNNGAWASTDPNDPDNAGAKGVAVGVYVTTKLPGDQSNPDALAKRSGYHILGWGESANGPALWDLGDNYDMPNVDTTLFLIWEEDSGINIYYISDDGGTVTVPAEQVKSVSGGANGSVATPKSGRVFVEWQLVDEQGQPIKALVAGATLVPDASMLPGGVFTEGMTFKAIFAEDTSAVTISYVTGVLGADGKVYIGPDEVGGYVLIDDEQVMPVSGTPTGTMAMANQGYRLLYWRDGNGKIIPPDYSTVEMKTGSVMPQRNADGAYEATTYTAVFKKIGEIVITLDGNATDAVVEPTGVKATGGVEVDPSTWTTKVERPGYTFLGWSTTSGDDNAVASGLDASSKAWNTPTNDITLYAVWKQNADVTVTLEAGDGEFAENAKQSTHTAPAGKLVAVNSMPVPTRQGYTFAGWTETQGNTEPDANLAAGDTWAMKATTLYAVWTANENTPFAVRYDLYRDGKLYKTHSTDASHTGKTGDNADANDWAITIDGYSLATSQPDAVKAIAADGLTVVVLNYEAKKLTLTVVLGDSASLKDGTANPAGAYYPDDTVTLPTADQIERAGYDFGGWELTWTDANGAAQSASYDPSQTGQGSFDMPAFDATLTAQWNASASTKYVIEYYKVINGTVSSAPFATTSESGTTGAIIDAMTHYYTIYKVGALVGYTLRAAADQTDAVGAIDANGKTVLKVYFDANAHTLTYHINATSEGGEFKPGIVTTVAVYTDQVVTLIPATDVTPPPSTHLEGWWTAALDDDAETYGIEPYVETYTVGNADVDLYAVWARNTRITVILIAGEGLFENGLNSEGYGYGHAEGNIIPVTDMPQPTRPGYALLGWSKKIDADTPDAYLRLTDTWTVEKTTLYAVWKANTNTKYTIEYYKVVDGGTPAKFDEKSFTNGTSGAEMNALTHAYTTGTVDTPAGYVRRADADQLEAKGNIAGDGTLVLKVYYDAVAQLYTIDLDGGTLSGFTFRNQGGTDPNLTAEYFTDSTVTLPNKGNMSKSGYELGGWTVTYNDGTKHDLSAGATFTAPGQAVSIVPKWDSTMSSFTVNHIKRFDGGTSVELTLTVVAPTGKTVSLANKDFDLYALQGYNYDTNSVSSGEVKADGSLVINLYYDAEVHTVTYDLGSAVTTWDGHSPLPYVVNAWTGKSIVIEGAGASAPVRAGYSFLGWTRTPGATEADDDIAPGANFTVGAADYVLNAVWKAYDVVLKFAGYDDSTPYLDETPVTGSMDDVDTMVGETLTLPALGFVRPGYTFDGWYVSDDAGDPKTLYNGSFLVPSVDKDGAALTLVAHWTPKDYTINYYALTDATNGSVELIDTRTFRWQELDAAKMNFTPSKRTGYLFSYWYTFATGKRAKITDKKTYATLVKNDESITSIDVYDEWTPRTYTVVYEGEGGTTPDPLSFTWDDTGLNFPEPVREGYVFLNWKTKPNGRGATMNDSTTISYLWGKLKQTDEDAEGTLFANWQAMEFAVTFDSAGGSPVDAVKALWAESGFAAATPVREGFTFAGWFTADGTAVDATTPYCELVSAADTSFTLVLYARWASATGTASVAGTAGLASHGSEEVAGAVAQAAANAGAEAPVGSSMHGAATYASRNSHAAAEIVLVDLGAGAEDAAVALTVAADDAVAGSPLRIVAAPSASTAYTTVSIAAEAQQSAGTAAGIAAMCMMSETVFQAIVDEVSGVAGALPPERAQVGGTGAADGLVLVDVAEAVSGKLAEIGQ